MPDLLAAHLSVEPPARTRVVRQVERKRVTLHHLDDIAHICTCMCNGAVVIECQYASGECCSSTLTDLTCAVVAKVSILITAHSCVRARVHVDYIIRREARGVTQKKKNITKHEKY